MGHQRLGKLPAHRLLPDIVKFLVDGGTPTDDLVDQVMRASLPTLWTPTAIDVRTSVAALKGTEQFAALAHRFYANFVERVIHYYVDRNLHNMVGAGRVAKSVHDLRAFNDAIRRHCDESALIMRAFAKDWLGKNHYRDGKQVSKADVRRFSAHAVEKMRIELEMRKGAP